MEATDSYQVLMSSLNYPDSDRLRAIMEDLLTPEQARQIGAHMLARAGG